MVKFPGVLKRIKQFGQEVLDSFRKSGAYALGKAVEFGRNILNSKVVDGIANTAITIGSKALPIPFGENILKIGYNKTKDNLNRFLEAGENIANNPNLGIKDVLSEYGRAVKDNIIQSSPIGTMNKIREGGLKAMLDELGF